MKQHVAEIVAAYVGKNRVNAAELPTLITTVSQSLASLGQAPATPSATLTPAVPLRRSVGAALITCLDCGWSGQMLKRHLTTAHGLTVDEYRARWSLHREYPMVTKNYSARRADLAKSFGLGKTPRNAKAKATR